MIGVVGLGFVGLTTALGFAHKGYEVYGYDVDRSRMKDLSGGHVPFHEPHLEEHLGKYAGNKFILSESIEDLVQKGKIIFFCVGTPSDARGRADLGYLKAAFRDVLKAVKPRTRKLLVIKSTVPPGTATKVVTPLVQGLGFHPGVDIGLANNPEFLREGYAWDDFLSPDRVVIGAGDTKSAKELAALYAPFRTQIHQVSLTSAEFIKYLSNTLLATMISFSNEMAMLAEAVGDINVQKAFHILHEDRRWNGSPASMASYVYPGCGFGGYCLPKDTLAAHALAQTLKSPTPVLGAVLVVNEKIKDHVVKKISRQADKNEVIGILGLAFKPGSDDVRDAPALSVIRRLLAKGYNKIIVYDPVAMEAFKSVHSLPVGYADSLKEIVRQAKVLVLLTSWPEFKEKTAMFKGKPLIDGRYFLEEKS